MNYLRDITSRKTTLLLDVRGHWLLRFYLIAMGDDLEIKNLLKSAFSYNFAIKHTNITKRNTFLSSNQ